MSSRFGFHQSSRWPDTECGWIDGDCEAATTPGRDRPRIASRSGQANRGFHEVHEQTRREKEMAIGDVMKASDPKFMIGVRNDDTAFADAPPELIRGHILDAYPNWHDCLKALFETLEEFKVPRTTSPDAQVLRTIVEAREDGRRFVVAMPEAPVTNWFPITPPDHIRYYRFDGVQEQIKAWRKDCSIPNTEMGRLAGTFADPPAFLHASSFEQVMPTAYEIPFMDFVGGTNLGPYVDRQAPTGTS